MEAVETGKRKRKAAAGVEAVVAEKLAAGKKPRARKPVDGGEPVRKPRARKAPVVEVVTEADHEVVVEVPEFDVSIEGPRLLGELAKMVRLVPAITADQMACTPIWMRAIIVDEESGTGEVTLVGSSPSRTVEITFPAIVRVPGVVRIDARPMEAIARTEKHQLTIQKTADGLTVSGSGTRFEANPEQGLLVSMLDGGVETFGLLPEVDGVTVTRKQLTDLRLLAPFAWRQAGKVIERIAFDPEAGMAMATDSQLAAFLPIDCAEIANVRVTAATWAALAQVYDGDIRVDPDAIPGSVLVQGGRTKVRLRNETDQAQYPAGAWALRTPASGKAAWKMMMTPEAVTTGLTRMALVSASDAYTLTITPCEQGERPELVRDDLAAGLVFSVTSDVTRAAIPNVWVPGAVLVSDGPIKVYASWLATVARFMAGDGADQVMEFTWDGEKPWHVANGTGRHVRMVGIRPAAS